MTLRRSRHLSRRVNTRDDDHEIRRNQSSDRSLAIRKLIPSDLVVTNIASDQMKPDDAEKVSLDTTVQPLIKAINGRDWYVICQSEVKNYLPIINVSDLKVMQRRFGIVVKWTAARNSLES